MNKAICAVAVALAITNAVLLGLLIAKPCGGGGFSGTLDVCTRIEMKPNQLAGGDTLHFTTQRMTFERGRVVSCGAEKTWTEYGGPDEKAKRLVL